MTHSLTHTTAKWENNLIEIKNLNKYIKKGGGGGCAKKRTLNAFELLCGEQSPAPVSLSLQIRAPPAATRIEESCVCVCVCVRVYVRPAMHVIFLTDTRRHPRARVRAQTTPFLRHLSLSCALQ